MLFKQAQSLIRCTLLASVTAAGLILPAQAQLSEQEFQMGRAREACTNQAKTQLLTVNRVVSTQPIGGSGGNMIGSEVILNVTRKGSTYDVKCNYDNTSRVATISSISTTQDPGKPVAVTNPLAKSCLAAINSKIRGAYSGVEKLNFASDTTRSYFISNAEDSIRGQGQFYQRSGRWYQFSYDCRVNRRTGGVASATYRI